MAKGFSQYCQARSSWTWRSLCLSLLSLLILTASQAAQAETNYLKQTFKSGIDGELDAYAFVLPVNQPANGFTLVVYFHGVTDDYTEPFKIPPSDTIVDNIQKEFPSLAVMSCNYGKKPSWGTRAARIDITHNIQDFMQAHPVDKIILVGSAMGACTALNYAACAPKPLRDKIIGVVAFSPVDDLGKLYRLSAAPWLKESLKKAFNGTPDEHAAEYYNNSLEANTPLFPTTAKVCIVTPLQDTVFPTSLQRRVARTLRNRSVDLKVIEVEGDFQLPTPGNIVQGLKFVLQ
jgi:pimeloyl-ACP methyl ester carboxylesterase